VARLPANTPESKRNEITAARASAQTRAAAPPSSDDRSGGTIVPFGGNSGTVDSAWEWSIDDHRPIVNCPGDGGECVQIDWNDIHFEYNIFFNSEVTLSGTMQARDSIGTFGVKNFTCQLKADKNLAIDPVRATFTNCVGAPKTKSLLIYDQTRSHTYTNELNWMNIKFESYDATYGISFGTVEYKSPNFKKESSGAQTFNY